MRSLGSLLLLTAVFFAPAATLFANWQTDDIPVCSDVALQQWPVATPDGFGGALFAWFDGRTSCIYAQRMNADGEPLWGPDGVPAGLATVVSVKPQITADGCGGAYVVFERDSLYGCWDMGLGPCLYIDKIYLSRVSATGSLLWQRRIHIPASGSFATDEAPCMLSDGEGGVVLVWQATSDLYCVPACMDCGCYWVNYHVLMQRVDSTGAFRWGESHVSIFQSTWESQPHPRIISDGAEGYIVTFGDLPNYGTVHLFAQRVSSAGETLWGPTGTMLFAGGGYESSPIIASDGRHGAIIAWSDGNSNRSYYAQRIDSAGAALWPSGGVPVCVASGTRHGLCMVTGAPGNAILAWAETRGGVPSVYAQRLDPAGSAIWTPGGIPLTSSGLQCVEPVEAADGTGGSIVSWVELPAGSGDALRGIWGDASGPLFAVGDRGLIYRFEDGMWREMASPTQLMLRGLWGSSTSDVFAVGDQGAILHWDGSSWQSMTSGTSSDLYGVWGAGPSSVYAVGNQGTIIHFDGSVWEATSYSGGGNFFGISGTSDDNVIAVGDYRLNGYIATYNGSTWSAGASGSYVQYTGVWKSPDNKTFIAVDDYATGACQGAIRYNVGNGWVTCSAGTSWAASGSVCGTSAGNVFALFSSGYVMRFDGTSWSAPAQISVYPMYGLWGTSGSDMYAVGQPRTVMHRQGSSWEFVCGSTGHLTAQRVDSTGTRLWTNDGARITLSQEEERQPVVVVDPAGLATFAWKDSRNGNWDIYSRRVSVERGPVVGTLLLSYAAAPARGGIAVRWQLAQYEAQDQFLISRSDGTGEPSWQTIVPSVERAGLSFDFVDSDGELGSIYRYRVEIKNASGTRFLFETEAVKMPALPLALHQNVPNPFNPSTRIRYYLPETARADLSVYDVAGRRIIRLVDRDQPRGMHEVTWNGAGTNGPCASGIYFCRLSAGKRTVSRKMVFLR